MKKLLSLLSILVVGGTSTLTVIACSNDSGLNPNPSQDINANVKTWSQQSSNLAKSIILGKTDSLNTNNILEKSLKENINNIVNAGDNSTGNSYANFVSKWGYNGNIDGISETNFNNNSATTVDNVTKKITEVTSILPIMIEPLDTILSKPNANTDLSTMLMVKDDKDNYSIVDEIYKHLPANFDFTSLKKYTTYIKPVIEILEQLLTQFQGFNPEDVLGQYYPQVDNTNPKQIQNALFNKKIDNKPAGWIANYYPWDNSDHVQIDSVTKNSDILKGDNQKLFQTWDQVALFKTGADLNYAIKNITKNYKWSCQVKWTNKKALVR